MLGSSQGSSQALSHFIFRGAWKQADKDTRRKSRLAGVTRLPKARSKGPAGAECPRPAGSCSQHFTHVDRTLARSSPSNPDAETAAQATWLW